MPTWRKLHTQVIDSLDFNEMPNDFTRLTWVLLPLVLDREGRGIYHPAWVKAKLYPMRFDVTIDMVMQAMGWFADRGMIVLYDANGRTYFYVPTFHKFQGDTKKEAASVLPAPPPVDSNTEVTPDPVQSNSGVTPDLVESRSSTDVDADVDTEKRESVKVAANAALSPEEEHVFIPVEVAVQKAPVSTSLPEKNNMQEVVPAVAAWHDATGKNPPRALHEAIYLALGPEPDVTKLREVYQAWIGRGYKPTNVAGILEWYRDGIPSGGPPNYTPPQQRKRVILDPYGNPLDD